MIRNVLSFIINITIVNHLCESNGKDKDEYRNEDGPTTYSSLLSPRAHSCWYPEAVDEDLYLWDNYGSSFLDWI